MNGLRQTRTWFSVAVLGFGLSLFWPAISQEATSTVPAPETIKSPVDFFRELLAMSPEEQEKALSNRTPQNRKRIQTKLADYTSLSPDERELRLQATELHWYLLPLMKIPVSERAEQLARIPLEMRKLVEERLEVWNILPPPLAQELLENEQVTRIFVQSQKVTPAELKKILADMPPSLREKLKADIQRWQTMPEEERQQLCRHFNQFFDLTPQEKVKALNTLSNAEREQMDKTLQEFEKLPKDQRTACVQSFQKFTSMSLPERGLFLKNAELWQKMSPDERQAWRDLVAQVPDWPPLPPGIIGAAETNEN